MIFSCGSLCCHILKHFLHINPDDQPRALLVGPIAFLFDDPFYETGNFRRQSFAEVFNVGFCYLEDTCYLIDNDPDIAAGGRIRYEYR